MMQVEKRNIFVWIMIMASAWVLFSTSYGALFGAYGGLNIAGPIAREFSKSGALGNVQNESDMTSDQKKAIESATVEKMRRVNWWLWWPLLNTLAWLITSLFLGFMKVVKFNEGLVILTYVPALLWHEKEWAPPGNILIVALTVLIALFVVHFVGRWMKSKRKAA